MSANQGGGANKSNNEISQECGRTEIAKLVGIDPETPSEITLTRNERGDCRNHARVSDKSTTR